MKGEYVTAVEDIWRRNGGTGDFAYLFSELEKFLELTRVVRTPIAVVSKTIDELWHAFICCTEAYQEYCLKTFGEYLHHRPRTDGFPVPAKSIRTFVTEYQRAYGSVPSVWFDGVPPSVSAYAFGCGETIPESYCWSGWPGRETRK